jgi:hypothetical protein
VGEHRLSVIIAISARLLLKKIHSLEISLEPFFGLNPCFLFDHCSSNFMGKQALQKIISKIKVKEVHIKTKNGDKLSTIYTSK